MAKWDDEIQTNFVQNMRSGVLIEDLPPLTNLGNLPAER
jgi:hypothetical protein